MALLKKKANTKMVTFFSQDFKKEENVRKAVANAYKLLSLTLTLIGGKLSPTPISY